MFSRLNLSVEESREVDSYLEEVRRGKAFGPKPNCLSSLSDQTIKAMAGVDNSDKIDKVPVNSIYPTAILCVGVIAIAGIINPLLVPLMSKGVGLIFGGATALKFISKN
jgi:hypothetical protein